MVKTANLTWGLSMCRFKVPVFLLDAGFNKQKISSVASKRLANIARRKSCVTNKQGLSNSMPNVHSHEEASISSEDVELALIINPPKQTSQFVSGKPSISHTKNSDPRTRLVVYLVSLALSLAALSILKLHRLLEWLTMDAEIPSLSTPARELHTKSSLISAILQTEVIRYTKQTDADVSLLSPPSSTPTSESTTDQHFSCASVNPDICIHFPRPLKAASERCLLCLVKLENSFWCQPTVLPCYRCQSEPTATSTASIKWTPPSRLNAGICRGQVVSNASTGGFLVQMCSGGPHLLSKKGLRLASAFFHGNKLWHITNGHTRPFISEFRGQNESLRMCGPDSLPTSPFRRPKRLVAWVAPTTSVPVSSFAPKITINPGFCSSETQCETLASVLEEDHNDEEVADSFLTPTFEGSQKLVATSSCSIEGGLRPTLDKLTRPCKCSRSTGTVVRCDRSVNVHTETRDNACSPILVEHEEGISCADDQSEAEGLELDDEGVYFASDYIEKNDLLEDEDECSEIPQLPYPKVHDTPHSEGLSDLVALTTSISDDLLQLESGCQELIYRVHANRIELDKVNDRLSFVWSNKDEYDSPANSVMENSWNSDYNRRYASPGGSFIASADSSCICHCHEAQANEPEPPCSTSDEPIEQSPVLSSTVHSNPSLIQSASPSVEQFFHPAISFEDDDAVGWSDVQIYQRNLYLPSPECITSNNFYLAS